MLSVTGAAIIHEVVWTLVSTSCLVCCWAGTSALRSRCDTYLRRDGKFYGLFQITTGGVRSIFRRAKRTGRRFIHLASVQFIGREEDAAGCDSLSCISQNPFFLETTHLLSQGGLKSAINLLRAARLGGKGKDSSTSPGPECFRAAMQSLAFFSGPKALFDKLIEELCLARLPTDVLTECCCVRYLCSSPNADIDYALKLYGSLIHLGVGPDLLTTECLVSACLRAKRYATAKELVLGLAELELHPTPALYASLITACGATGDVDAALQALEDLRLHASCDPASLRLGYSAAISAFSQNLELDKALALHAEWRQLDLRDEAQLILPLLVAAIQSDRVDLAIDLATQARGAGIAGPDSAIVSACELLLECSGYEDTAQKAYLACVDGTQQERMQASSMPI